MSPLLGTVFAKHFPLCKLGARSPSPLHKREKKADSSMLPIACFACCPSSPCPEGQAQRASLDNFKKTHFSCLDNFKKHILGYKACILLPDVEAFARQPHTFQYLKEERRCPTAPGAQRPAASDSSCRLLPVLWGAFRQKSRVPDHLCDLERPPWLSARRRWPSSTGGELHLFAPAT